MLKEYFWVFQKLDAAPVWDIDNIPEGAIAPRISHVESDDGGVIHTPKSQTKTLYGLQISFGADAVSGTAYGSYFLEGPEAANPNTDGVVVTNSSNIVINNYPKEEVAT